MAKKRRTAKQKAASLRNLAKAKRGKGGAIVRRKKSAAKVVRRRAPSLERRMAKAGGGPAAMRARGFKHPRKHPGRTRAQHAASLANLAKARASRSARKARGEKHRVRAYSYHRRPARIRVPAHMSFETRRRKKGRKHHGQTAAQRRASMRNLQKAHAARRRHAGRRASYRRRKGHARENPAVDWMEMAFGLFSGVLGFAGADVLDRVLATHTLVATDGVTPLAQNVTAAGQVMDNPPTSGDYANLFNATAIAAPMNLPRWGAGLALGLLPIGIGTIWVVDPYGRTFLQMFGTGAVLRTVGKGLIDWVAQLTKFTPIGMQLFDGEMTAAALQANDQTTIAMLPSTGFAAGGGAAAAQTGTPAAGSAGVPGMGATQPGCACINCTVGIGACCADAARDLGYPSVPVAAPPAPAGTTPTSGVTLSVPGSAPGGASPASLPAAASGSPSFAQQLRGSPAAAPAYASPLQGAPGMGADQTTSRNPYRWGADKRAA
jgi:hypothetical protein